MSHEVWEEYYDRLAALIAGASDDARLREHAAAWPSGVARHLSERLGDEAVTAHHGSLSKETRLDAETRLKHGHLKALVATASLELGIDIGHVDLVCQIGSPHRIATLLQRVGRSGHTIPGRRRAGCSRCRATTWSSARRCCARSAAASSTRIVVARRAARRAGAADRRRGRRRRTAARTISSRWCAAPGRIATSTARRFDAVVAMLADGFATRRGRRGALVHRDEVHAAACAGAGGAAARAHLGRRHSRGRRLSRRARAGRHVHRHAQRRLRHREHGAATSFSSATRPGACSRWRRARSASPTRRARRRRFRSGSARRRRAATSCRARSAICAPSCDRHRLADAPDVGRRRVIDWLDGRRRPRCGSRRAGRSPISPTAARARASCRRRTRSCSSGSSTKSGGMQLVLHAPFGSRINKAWGLALRKRFCRQFNFELQAAATEDALLLSLGPQHSFPLADVFRYLHPATARDVLVQAFLDAPVFQTRWRWNTTISLAVPRDRGGRKVPPQLQRMLADDLMAAAFPDAAACLENIPGDRQIPDHPLVNQTVRDCLEEAMDFDGARARARAHPSRRDSLVARDTPEPSPFAHEILNARPYAFLDDAPLEERRTQAVHDEARQRPGDRRRTRRARRASDRARARGGPARSARRRRAARRAGDRRLSDRGGSRAIHGRVRVARGARPERPRHARVQLGMAAGDLGRGRTAARDPGRPRTSLR